MREAAATLPDGWLPGDRCCNCAMALIHHRLGDLACHRGNSPVATCPAAHGPACWHTDSTYRADPIEAAKRRAEKIMAPGYDANGGEPV